MLTMAHSLPQVFKSSALALALTLGCHSAFAAESPRSFIDDASAAGVGEIQAGQLAQEKGVADDIKAFGGMMVEDHTLANNKLKEIAQSKKLEVSEDPTVMAKIKTMILDLRSAKSFDQAYANNQVKAHEAAVKLFEEEAAGSEDAQLQAFAKETLPKLKEHLAKAKELAAAHGGDAAKD
jgi:putative membrane protein